MMSAGHLLAAAACAAALAAAGCAQIECGEGTIERNGVCVDGDDGQGDGACGPGTRWEPTFGCVAAIECGDNTVAVEQDDGTIVCEGTGGGPDLPCPAAPPGKVTLCGQLVDVEDSTDVSDGAGTLCDENAPTASGACSLQIRFYEALSFASDPTGTPPLQIDRLRYNSNGRYVAEGIPAPALGFLGVGIDDNDNGANDNYVLAGVALPAIAGDRRDDLTSYVVRRSTDELWTTNSGPAAELGGKTFNEAGVYVPIFLHRGNPVAGVQPTETGVTQPNDTFYFADTDPALRRMVDADLTTTGPNGTALMINSELVNHSGTGGDIAPCIWPADLAASIEGVTFVQERHTEDAITSEVCK